MNTKLNYKTTEVILLILIWLILIVSPIIFRNQELDNWQEFLKPMDMLVPLFILFLINRFLLVPVLLFKKKNFQYLLSVVAIIGIFTFVMSLYSAPHPKHPNSNITRNEHMRPPPHIVNPKEGFPPPFDPGRQENNPLPVFANFLIFSFLLVGFDTGLRLSFKLASTEAAKNKLEKENVGNQLAFLRNQVSPHFFMNTLNNIHALIDIDTEEAKESIIRLSKLMRHLLYDSEMGEIRIQKEIEFINNYVDLMKLRYSEKVKIDFYYQKESPDKAIPPLLFTSFVENAFKHGISYEKPSFIKMELTTTDNELSFIIKNNNHKNNRVSQASGIGIANARKRLDLLYGDSYTLDIIDSHDEFAVNLKIPI